MSAAAKAACNASGRISAVLGTKRTYEAILFPPDGGDNCRTGNRPQNFYRLLRIAQFNSVSFQQFRRQFRQKGSLSEKQVKVLERILASHRDAVPGAAALMETYGIAAPEGSG